MDQICLRVSPDSGAVKSKPTIFHERKVYIFFKEIRVELDNLLLEKIASPNLDLMTDRRGSIIIKTITKILTTE